jgi:hypothetical protein
VWVGERERAREKEKERLCVWERKRASEKEKETVWVWVWVRGSACKRAPKLTNLSTRRARHVRNSVMGRLLGGELRNSGNSDVL